MDKKEFSRVRCYLGKTQIQMAQLLGVSQKGVESFEQGWRNIPVHVERQMLFLVAKKDTDRTCKPCWELMKCPGKTKEKCPAWEFKSGELCWFINGTLCDGDVQKSWEGKMRQCRKCKVLRSMLSGLRNEKLKA